MPVLSELGRWWQGLRKRAGRSGGKGPGPATGQAEEQAATGVRTQAQAEAEAARIIAQARQEAEAIKQSAALAAHKEAEDILSEAKRKVEEGKSLEPTAQLQEEKSADEAPAVTAGGPSGPSLAEQNPGPDETGMGTALSERDGQALYAGEVELVVGVPVDLKMLAKLFNFLQTTSEIKIHRISGSWDRDTTVTVAVDKPIPLISIISSRIPG
ncbi:MAG: hypothetical protein Q8P00_03725, partial [Dehalococcoidia bacterium]|nr:hypothetical protein [Dehalococcoidia bacterium]